MLKIVQCTLLLSVFLSGALTCAAQAKHKKKPSKRPPPVSDSAPQVWREFSSKEGKFKILFPGTPQQHSAPIELSSGESLMHIVSYQSSIVYSVMYTDCPVAVDDPAEVKDYFDNLRIGELKSGTASGLNPRVLNEIDMPLDRHPGRFLYLDLTDKLYRRRAVLVKGRIYIITAMALKDRNTSVGINRYESLSMKFLNSFTLILDGMRDENKVT
jgi:hypothetical protein